MLEYRTLWKAHRALLMTYRTHKRWHAYLFQGGPYTLHPYPVSATNSLRKKNWWWQACRCMYENTRRCFLCGVVALVFEMGKMRNVMHQWVMSSSMSHAAREWLMLHMNESCHSNESRHTWMMRCRVVWGNVRSFLATQCNMLQHVATHRNMLQHAATRCNTMQHPAAHCNTPQHSAPRCTTLQHTATHCNTLSQL